MSTYTVELDGKTSEALVKAAAERSINAEELIACATQQFLAEQNFDPEWTDDDIAAIEEGIAQLDRGESIPHEEVMAAMRAKFGG